jgi:hypothetical protein
VDSTSHLHTLYCKRFVRLRVLIKTHIRYLYTCACVVLTRLVRLFYANLEVAQEDDRRLLFQSTVDGHIITVDPQIIVTLSEYQSLSCPAVLIMRWCFLPLWTISESTSMQFHREKSVLPPSGSAYCLLLMLPPSGSAHCLLLIACWPK